MKQKKKWTGLIVLTVITVGAAIALASVNLATEGQRNEQASLVFEAGIRALFPEADAGTDGIVSLEEESENSEQDSEAILRYTIYADGTPIGMVIRSQSAGYAGPIEVLTGIENNGTLRGIQVGGTSFAETEGLGSKVQDVSFTEQFVGMQPPLTLGEDIDVISGATISSRAVVNAVNDGYASKEGANSHINTEDPSTANTGVPEVEGTPVSISTMGYAGPVLVQLRFGEKNEIIAIQVGNERFLETAGIGSQVQEDVFLEQFLDQTPPLSEEAVDLISGATISSRAVLEAINEASAFLNP